MTAGGRPTSPGRSLGDRAALVAALAGGGCVAADEEADELLAATDGDGHRLAALVGRRLAGEPLAWLTGQATFCGRTIRVDPGVYVPRWQTEPLARRAAGRLPPAGIAVDLCTGSGALAATRPRATVWATDTDPRAVACARANGVRARRGDLFDPLPGELAGRVDVVVGVVPYVPTPALALLPRDTLVHEGPLAYDGGPDGTTVLCRAVAGAARVLRPGGALLLELGDDQAERLAAALAARGFGAVEVLEDAEGDVRGVEATFGPSAAPVTGRPSPAPPPG